MCLDMTETCVYVFISRFLPFFFFLFFQRMNSEFTVQRQKLLFMHCSSTVHGTYSHFIQKKYIKNGSHSTIHTFKNYFATVFSVLVKINCIQMDPMCWKILTGFYRYGSKRTSCGLTLNKWLLIFFPPFLRDYILSQMD